MNSATQLTIGIIFDIVIVTALILKTIAVYKSEHSKRAAIKRANYYRRQARRFNGQWRALDQKIIFYGHFFDK